MDDDDQAKPARSPELVAFMVALGARLQQARQALGISLEKAGECVGKKRAAVHHWETGVNPVNIADLWTLAGMYQTTVQALIVGEPSDADLARALSIMQSRLNTQAASIAATPAESGKLRQRVRA